MRSLFATAILLCLSACSGPIETRVSSAGDTSIGALSYQLPENADQKNPDLTVAKRLLVGALAERNIRRTNSAPLLLQITLSQRAADLGLKKGDGAKAKIIAAPKEKKAFQSCKDKEYRLAIRFSKISDGAMVYAGDAAEYHCKASVADALPAMVKVIVADMDGPRGDKVLTRRGEE